MPWLKRGSLPTNELSIFRIVRIGIVLLPLSFLIYGARYPMAQITAFFVALLFTLTLVRVSTWFKSEELFKRTVQGLSVLPLSSSKIDTV